MATFNLFDRALKVLACHYAETFLRLAFPDAAVQVVGTEANVELALPEKWVDFIHRVRFNGREYVFHLEFQLEHRADLPKRVFIYSAGLTDKYDLPVVTLVLYLERRASAAPTEYAVEFAGTVTNRFTYRVLRLWDYEERIRSGQLRELAPLLVMWAEPADAATLAVERALILQEPDEKKRGDLLATAVTVASRYFDRGFLWQFFAEEVELMRHATFIEDWIEEGMEKGRQEGLQQGLQQGRREALAHILVKRFGPLPRHLPERLERLTLAQLEELIDQALVAQDWAAFEQALAQFNA